jgi:hypothetical protein
MIITLDKEKSKKLITIVVGHLPFLNPNQKAQMNLEKKNFFFFITLYM